MEMNHEDTSGSFARFYYVGTVGAMAHKDNVEVEIQSFGEWNLSVACSTTRLQPNSL